VSGGQRVEEARNKAGKENVPSAVENGNRSLLVVAVLGDSRDGVSDVVEVLAL
jgi:hypothetical protein